MASIATSRATVGSIFGAVTQAATTVSSTFDAANKAVGMLNTTITDAAERQQIRSKLDMAIFEKTLHQDKAKELAESRVELKKYMSTSTDHAECYQKAFEELEEFLKN